MIDTIQSLVILLPTILMAVTVHEVAHGWMADRLGDHTARMQGRLTLNPIKHLDLMGTLAFFLTQMIGWAKPVPVNPYNFKNPRKDMVWVGLAGPAANFLLAALAAIVHHLLSATPVWHLAKSNDSMTFAVNPLCLISNLTVRINIGLAIFNAIPVPPLDGSRILAGLLPANLAVLYGRTERYGFLILILLLLTGMIDKFIFPIIHTLTEAFLQTSVSVC